VLKEQSCHGGDDRVAEEGGRWLQKGGHFRYLPKKKRLKWGVRAIQQWPAEGRGRGETLPPSAKAKEE